MTKQDKQLLLQDLCAALPYGVKVQHPKGLEWRDSNKEQPEEYNDVLILDPETNQGEVLPNCVSVSENLWWVYWDDVLKMFCPATKEQHDLLFQKMKEAGYEWDDEKKELKKAELTEWIPKDGDVVRLKEDNGQRWTISLSVEPDTYDKWFLSLNTENGVGGGCVSDYLLKENYTFVNNPLEEANKACKEEATKLGKAIVEAIKPTEWSEEDESCLDTIVNEMRANKREAKSCEHKTYDKLIEWLKSLKTRLK